MAVDGPAHGTNMGSMQALNTSSSVSGATTWFLNQRTSLKHSDQNHGSVGVGGVESPFPLHRVMQILYIPCAELILSHPRAP